MNRFVTSTSLTAAVVILIAVVGLVNSPVWASLSYWGYAVAIYIILLPAVQFLRKEKMIDFMRGWVDIDEPFWFRLLMAMIYCAFAAYLIYLMFSI